MTTPQTALEGLIGQAMSAVTPLMQQVYDDLNSSANQFLYVDDGNLLFAASVTLHLKSAEVFQLVQAHGIQAVADAFTARFGRPIIEGQQITDFADPGTCWGAFWTWSQQLWSTIESGVLSGNPHLVADQVFDHNKGYNRAINFAADAAMPDDVAAALAPPLASSFTTPAPTPTDGSACGLWLYQGLDTAGLLQSGATVSWTDFDTIARANWATIATALGDASLDPATVLTNDMKDALDGMSIVS